jgi:predicted nucleotidyltransferase
MIKIKPAGNKSVPGLLLLERKFLLLNKSKVNRKFLHLNRPALTAKSLEAMLRQKSQDYNIRVTTYLISLYLMETNREILERIKATVCKYLPDAEVLLFGSRARNEAASDSDFDVLVVTSLDLSPKQKLPIKTTIRKDLLTEGIRSDILIQSKKEVKKKRKLPGHIIKNILNEAIFL